MKKSSFEIYNEMRRSAINRKDYRAEMTVDMKRNVKARIDQYVERINRLESLNVIDASEEYRIAYQMYNLLARN